MQRWQTYRRHTSHRVSIHRPIYAHVTRVRTFTRGARTDVSATIEPILLSRHADKASRKKQAMVLCGAFVAARGRTRKVSGDTNACKRLSSVDSSSSSSNAGTHNRMCERFELDLWKTLSHSRQSRWQLSRMQLHQLTAKGEISSYRRKRSSSKKVFQNYLSPKHSNSAASDSQFKHCRASDRTAESGTANQQRARRIAKADAHS